MVSLSELYNSNIAISISFIFACIMVLSSNIDGARGGIAGLSYHIPKIMSTILFLFPYKKHVPIHAIICQLLNYAMLLVLIANHYLNWEIQDDITKTIILIYSIVCAVFYGIDIATSQ
ncbi:MAG: hypothetical protein LBT21_05710 [Oscillospiraceae bacterium]|nr:hypothetical protein [Oscillospiraceae bacterium]